MKGKPMEKMDIYNPFTDKKEKVIILRGKVTPEKALKVLEKANDEFACKKEIPWKLAERL